MDRPNLEKIFSMPELLSDDVSSHIAVAHNYVTEGSSDIAVGILTETVKRFPDSAKAFFELGYLQYELDRLDEAIVNLKQSIALDPIRNPKKYFTLAEMSSHSDAVLLYETGINLYKSKLTNTALDGILTRA